MITIKEVLQKAGEMIGGFPLTSRKIAAAGFDPTTFLADLIDKLQKCTDAKDSKLIKELVGIKNEWTESITA